MKFLSDMMSSSCYYIRSVVSLMGNEELNAIVEFYAVDVPCVIKNSHEIAFKSVETHLLLLHFLRAYAVRVYALPN